MTRTKHEKSLIAQCFQPMTDKICVLRNYRICMCIYFWTITNLLTGEFFSDMISITHKIMPKTYPSGSGTQFGPSATPYVTNVPVKECRSIAGRCCVSLRHFNYSNITLPASRYHMLHVEK